jgi:hypothetical protein
VISGHSASGAAVRSARQGVSVLLCAAILLGAGGCVSTRSYRPDTFDTASNDDIRVYLRERRMIEFEGGSYRSVDSAGTRYLVGNGIDNRPDSALARVPFSGYLPFSGIDRIDTRKMDAYSTLYVVAFIGIFAWLGFSSDITN